MSNVVLVAKYDTTGEQVKRSIKIVDVPEDIGIDFYYEQIGCTTFDVTTNNAGNDLFVDDEGLLKSGDPVIKCADGLTLAGDVLITKGINAEGETLFFDVIEDTKELEKAALFLQTGKLEGFVSDISRNIPNKRRASLCWVISNAADRRHPLTVGWLPATEPRRHVS